MTDQSQLYTSCQCKKWRMSSHRYICRNFKLLKLQPVKLLMITAFLRSFLNFWTFELAVLFAVKAWGVTMPRSKEPLWGFWGKCWRMPVGLTYGTLKRSTNHLKWIVPPWEESSASCSNADVPQLTDGSPSTGRLQKPGSRSAAARYRPSGWSFPPNDVTADRPRPSRAPFTEVEEEEGKVTEQEKVEKVECFHSDLIGHAPIMLN